MEKRSDHVGDLLNVVVELHAIKQCSYKDDKPNKLYNISVLNK